VANNFTPLAADADFGALATGWPVSGGEALEIIRSGS